MSADRRFNQRRFHLEESTTLNGGARTVFIEHMPPGTTVPPHHHTRFSETFDLISGTMTVHATTTLSLATLESSSQPLQVGKKVSVPPGMYHKYVVGSEPTVLRAIVEPGDADFERLLMVLNGLGADGELEGLGDSVVLMAVVMGLSDAHLMGDSGQMLEEVRTTRGEEVRALRERLLARYDNEEQLRALLK